MTRFRIFCLKNAMIAANLLATGIGAGLLYILYEFVIQRHQTADAFDNFKGKGVALGLNEDWQYEMNEKFGLAKGQIIVLSTDGVWEAQNRDGEIFGKERLHEIIRENSNKKAEEIIEAVIVDMNKFQKDTAIEDDITLVVIKIEEDLEKLCKSR